MSTRATQYAATVLRREQVSEHLVRIVLGGLDDLTSTGVPDEWVGLVVPGQFQSRYYTVRRFADGELTLDDFEPAELAGMPPGRAVMLAAGAPAALIRLTHWSETPYADQVKASEKHFAHRPTGASTEAPGPARTAAPDDPAHQEPARR